MLSLHSKKISAIKISNMYSTIFYRGVTGGGRGNCPHHTPKNLADFDSFWQNIRKYFQLSEASYIPDVLSGGLWSF